MYILVAGIVIVLWLVGVSSKKASDTARKDLKEDDLQTFQGKYVSAKARADMPMKFDELASTSDRARRLWIVGVLAIVLALIWITYAGPNLGLTLNQ